MPSVPLPLLAAGALLYFTLHAMQSQALQRRSHPSDTGVSNRATDSATPAFRSSVLQASMGDDATWTVEEANALLALKQSVLDVNGILANWTLDKALHGGCTGPCTPTGVACWDSINCSKTGHVTGIDLSSLGSHPNSQSLPGNISSLQYLEWLYISGDQVTPRMGLSGSIPLELSLCTSLTRLELPYNFLYLSTPNGTLPFPLSLQYLRLPNNWIAGPIPDALAQLPNLTYLDLSYNKISGGIPSALAASPRMVNLELDSNQLSGPIPSAFGKATALTFLSLMNNRLSGMIPTSLSSMSSLYALVLSNNSLSGSVPMALSALPSLVHISLSLNLLSGTLPVGQLCQPGTLSLKLAHNLFTGFLPPPESYPCTNLTSLDISYNSLEGSLEPLAALVSLIYLTASGNQFSGSIPSSLAPDSLKDLELNGNQLTGQVPDRCFGTLLLSHNLLTGLLPKLHPDCSTSALNLSHNALSGTLPSLGPASSSLTTLDLSHNNFSGSLPKLNCSGLIYLDVSYNMLAGALPDFATCTQLTQLDLSSNHFSGSIGTEGTARGLKEMDQGQGRGTYTGGARGRLVASAGGGSLLRGASEGPASGPPLGRPQSMGREREGVRRSGASHWNLRSTLLLPRNGALTHLNVSHNSFSGRIPTGLRFLLFLDASDNRFDGGVAADSLQQLPFLQHLDLSGNALSAPADALVGLSNRLTFLDISRNNFSGHVLAHLAPPALPLLQLLNVSHNHLNGTVPFGFAQAAGRMQLDLSHNLLCGKVPPPLAAAYGALVFADNLCLCDGPGLPHCSKGSPQRSAAALAGVLLGASVPILIVLVVVAVLIRRRKNGEWEDGALVVFRNLGFDITIQHILDSTEHFNDKYSLGRGGFGTVYRADLAQGLTVAIKRLSAESSQGQQEFLAEMKFLGQLQHRNLVALLAAFVAQPPSHEKLLIYSFLEGSSLDKYLHGGAPIGQMDLSSWPLRRRILEDVAHGLKYLHHGCRPGIVHRDMKPANVLLDSQLRAYVADFGLARQLELGSSSIGVPGVVGTPGYIAPEHALYGRLSTKNDVFAFGVVILQMVTGKSTSHPALGARGLAQWVRIHPAARVWDPNLVDAQEHAKEIETAIAIGVQCVARVPVDRPTMDEVHNALCKLSELTNPPAVNPHEYEAVRMTGGHTPLLSSSRHSCD